MIIGLCGAAGAGKSTVADRLVAAHGFQHASFADPIYEAVSAISGMPVKSLKDRRNKESVIEWLGVSPRMLLQTLGTEWGRNMVRQDIWIQSALRRIGGDVVFSDVRFDNEAEAIVDRGGEVWLVLGRAADLGGAASHSSEAGVSAKYVCRTLHNCGQVSDLYAAVDCAYDRLLTATMKG